MDNGSRISFSICEVWKYVKHLHLMIAGQFSLVFGKPKQWEPLYCNKHGSNCVTSFGFLCTHEEHETIFYKDKNLQSDVRVET